jgi:hypothetical protein
MEDAVAPHERARDITGADGGGVDVVGDAVQAARRKDGRDEREDGELHSCPSSCDVAF